jgi:predicted TIM-barrel fold metal-dependent hydrolase
MGGAALWVRGRVRFGWPSSAVPQTQEAGRLYYDTLAFQPEAIAAAVRMVGHDKLLFGSDYPHLGNAQAVWHDVVEARLGQAAEHAIASENARQLFDSAG